MGIYKRGSKWYFQLTYRGQRYVQTTGLDAVSANKTFAKEQLARFRSELEAIHGLRRTRREFCQASDSFLRQNDAEAAAASTAKRNRTSFASLMRFFAGWKVDEVSAAAVDDYKVHRLTVDCVRPVTLKHDLDALAKFFNRYAMKRGLATRNPMAEVKRPSDRDAHSIYVLPPEEEATYFEAAKANPTMWDMARLMILTGVRPEELLSSKRTAFDAGSRSLKITRGKTAAAKRTIPLTEDALQILTRRFKASEGAEWLFPSPVRRGHHLVKMNNAHDQACLDSGTAFRLYDLRHTWATRAIESGTIDVATVAALLGHANLRAVHLYIHPQESQKRTAVDRYNEFLKTQKSKAKTKAS